MLTIECLCGEAISVPDFDGHVCRKCGTRWAYNEGLAVSADSLCKLFDENRRLRSLLREAAMRLSCDWQRQDGIALVGHHAADCLKCRIAAALKEAPGE